MTLEQRRSERQSSGKNNSSEQLSLTNNANDKDEMFICRQRGTNRIPVMKEKIDQLIKVATSRFAYVEKFFLNFPSSSFVIRVNLLHL